MTKQTMFCIIDPTSAHQPVFDRVGLLADVDQVHVHAYACVPPSFGQPAGVADGSERYEEADYETWLEDLTDPLRQRGFSVDVELERHEDWRAALAPAARRCDADLIIKSTYRHSAVRRRLLKTADWLLLRSAHCPVLFVKDEQLECLDRVLAAVNITDPDPAHQALTEAVIEHARRLADLAGAELFAVNAYSGSLNRISPKELAQRVGIERRYAHVADMSPEQLIAETASEVGADLVVIGTVARRGLPGMVVGNTAERILDTVTQDMLTVVASAASERGAAA